jgi:guanylate kinase
MKNNLFIVSGPSGAGEDSIIEGIKMVMPIERVITTTTREMRPGESIANPYYFISKNEFVEGVENDNFVEFAKEYNNNYYGATKDEIERVKKCDKIGIWKIEYKGVITAKKLFPNIKAILINAPLRTLARRIRMRDDASDEFVKERMRYTEEWLKHTHVYDYIINNTDGNLDKSIKKLQKIIEENK